MKEKGPIWKLDQNDSHISQNGTKETRNGHKEAPKLKDVIGLSLKFVGPYKKLDNKKQVVALIDDVIIVFILLLNLNLNSFGSFFNSILFCFSILRICV